MRFNADISGLKKGLADANRQIRLANSQFQAAASGSALFGIFNEEPEGYENWFAEGYEVHKV